MCVVFFFLFLFIYVYNTQQAKPIIEDGKNNNNMLQLIIGTYQGKL